MTPKVDPSPNPLSSLAASFAGATAPASPFLAQGCCLEALILFEAGISRNEMPMFRAANSRILDAMREMETIALSTSLYRGVTGVGWLLKCYDRFITAEIDGEFLPDLDDIILDGITEQPDLNVDIIDGLAGIIVYATEPCAHFDSESSLILRQKLQEVTVQTLSRYLDRKTSSHSSSGYRNLGFAHGIPGLLRCASALLHSSENPSALQGRILDCFTRLWEERIDAAGSLDFPAMSGDHSATRVAWCYGTPGLALAYSRAASLDSYFRPHVEQLSRSCVARIENGGHGIADASLCHGWAGLHLILEEVHKAQDLDFLPNHIRAAEFSSSEFLMYDEYGVPYTRPVIRGKEVRMNSLLEGTSGTVLALHSDRSSRERWGRLLGLYV